jgi:hypothetical protein
MAPTAASGFAMVSRSLAIPALLAASVAVPYAATKAPEWRAQWNAAAPASVPTVSSGQALAFGPEAARRTAAMIAPPVGPGAALYPTPTPLEGTPTYSIAEVFRMDVTKEWVYQRWPRKSTALASLDMYGVRVPLVTGTQVYDLAGSLTYYFGADGRVQRISFRGRTGDTTQIVTLVAQRYGLQPQPAVVAGEQLYQVRRANDVISSLHTRPAPVLWASSPHDSFTVELDLQDPATGRPLEFDQPALPPPPAAPAAAASLQTGGAAGDAVAESTTSEKPAEPAWKAFFPRQRLGAEQINNLDHDSMYQ